MAESTVDVPVVGNVDKKWLWIGGATLAAILGWAYYRRSQAPTVIEEGIEGNDFLTDDGSGNVPGQTGNSNTGGINPEVIDTLAEWTADVVQKLGVADWDTGFIYTTIGKWTAGEGLTISEKSLVLAAIAASGQPPGGPYPIKTAQPVPDPGPNPKPIPDPAPVPGPGPSTVGAPLEVNLYDWAYQYGGFVKLFGSTDSGIGSLNPGYRKYMRWDGPAGSTKIPVFWSGWSGRTPPLGIPPVRVR